MMSLPASHIAYMREIIEGTTKSQPGHQIKDIRYFGYNSGMYVVLTSDGTHERTWLMTIDGYDKDKLNQAWCLGHWIASYETFAQRSNFE